MLADPPEGTTPVISVAPESWARVPVQAGQTLSLVMHGYVAAPHFHEVRLHVLPGVTDLAGGPMPRHPESVAGLPARTSLVLTDQAQGLPDIPEGATAARIAVEGGVARVATAAPEPTANDGERWGDGSVWQISGRDDLLALRAVTASGAPKLSITYTKG
ncbi:hypothetical protein [Deinococcus sp. YIM 77859]|nr:hypothetical protein [Deinococcus sp. YIM 77859]